MSDHLALLGSIGSVGAGSDALFTVMDVVENFFYVVGYLMLSVTYRLITIAFWEMKTSIEETDPLQERMFPRISQNNTMTQHLLLAKLRNDRKAECKDDTPGSDHGGSYHARNDFSESEFESNLETFAILRLLSVLAALILQLVNFGGRRLLRERTNI